LRSLAIHGTPSLGHDPLIAKFFTTNRLESLSIDSQVTKLGLCAMLETPYPHLERLYAEPSREEGPLFSEALLLHSNLRRIGFSHGLRSLPYNPVDFQGLHGSSLLAGLTHWTGPSAIMESFFGTGADHVEHVVLDQMVVLDGMDGAESESLRPRNLSTSPETEAARVSTIHSLLSRWTSLRSLDVVLSSSHSIKDIIGRCKSGLTELRVKCTETPEHTAGLISATSAISKMASLRDIHIASPAGYADPDIERDLERQHDVVDRWARTCSIERVAFSAWLRWHRVSQGEWTPVVTSPELARTKTARWKRRQFAVKDWEGHLVGTLGPDAVCDTPVVQAAHSRNTSGTPPSVTRISA